MRNKFIIIILLLSVKFSPAQEAVSSLDTSRFEGKWYVLASIPIYYEKAWCCVTETFKWNPKGYFDLSTSYKTRKGGKSKTIEQRLKPVPESDFAKYSADDWILKTYYWVFTVADDYSHAIAGHPDKTYIYLLSREPFADEDLHNKFMEWCRVNEYDPARIKRMVQEEQTNPGK